jgi:hypothetical protein
MTYYSYHSMAKKLINESHLIKYEIVEKWNNIKPALVLYFDNHRPMPIRDSRWDEYMPLLNNMNTDAKEYEI